MGGLFSFSCAAGRGNRARVFGNGSNGRWWFFFLLFFFCYIIFSPFFFLLRPRPKYCCGFDESAREGYVLLKFFFFSFRKLLNCFFPTRNSSSGYRRWFGVRPEWVRSRISWVSSSISPKGMVNDFVRFDACARLVEWIFNPDGLFSNAAIWWLNVVLCCLFSLPRPPRWLADRLVKFLKKNGWRKKNKIPFSRFLFETNCHFLFFSMDLIKKIFFFPGIPQHQFLF